MRKTAVSRIVLIVFLIVCVCKLNAQQADAAAMRWVDSVYNTLAPAQRIGQLMMLRANSVIDSAEIKELKRVITQYNIGGLCFFKGGPVRQAILTNYYQQLAATPLLISMDAEWGLGMRLDSTVSFPRQMTLGAVRNEQLIERFGRAAAVQLRRMGVHVSFSPVADINSNPANPVINSRSFGEDKYDVALKAMHYHRGLQQGGIITVAKHFPGHGDTDTDSHVTLPFVNHSAETIDTLDLYPFKKLIADGVDGVMVAHLNVPAIEPVKNLPSSLSQNVITGLLRNRLGFNGLIFTDALDMKGVANYAKSGETELMALRAGTDVLLLPSSVDLAVAAIQRAIDAGTYSQEELERHCKKILFYKYKAGLNHTQKVESANLISDLNTREATALNDELYSNALTLISNRNGLLPVSRLDTLKIASLTIGNNAYGALQSRMDTYAQVTHFLLPKNFSPRDADSLLNKISAFNLVLVNITDTHPSPSRGFGISSQTIALVDTLLEKKTCVLNLFAVPYSANLFNNLLKAGAVLIAYQDNASAYEAVAQTMFGAIPAMGTLPVSINANYILHHGLVAVANGRMAYHLSDYKGLSPEFTQRIDALINDGLAVKAYPGCQVLVAKDGNVVFEKSYGYADYISGKPVTNTDLYDLASITKVAATTLAVMKLYDEGKLHLDDRLSRYLPYLVHSNKKKVTIREVMTHQAGFVAWIPFYKATLKNGKPDTTLYKKVYSEEYPVRVADSLFLRKDYRKQMFDSIIKSPVSEKKSYLYSDLSFILMQQVVENITGQPLDQYVEDNFYKPMGLRDITFKPLEKMTLQRVMPTEDDHAFRQQVVRGYVHDQAAAMFGGVSGHAGLFGSANDLAVVFQMLVQNGYYGGVRYIDSTTVKLFTSRQYPNSRRGLGFDKPQLNPHDPGPACADAPASSYGHTGFTGTYVWADPDHKLVLVFLTNRVNPDAESNKLVNMDFRTRLQQILYDAFPKKVKGEVPVFDKNKY